MGIWPTGWLFFFLLCRDFLEDGAGLSDDGERGRLVETATAAESTKYQEWINYITNSLDEVLAKGGADDEGKRSDLGRGADDEGNESDLGSETGKETFWL